MICAGIDFQLHVQYILTLFLMFPVISYCKEREILFKVESNVSTLNKKGGGGAESVAIFLKQ